MPELSRFYGIVIYMYYFDHNPPHFHARYGEREGVISIQTLSVIVGNLPHRALGMVIEWASLHGEELETQWKKATRGEPLDKIDPL